MDSWFKLHAPQGLGLQVRAPSSGSSTPGLQVGIPSFDPRSQSLNPRSCHAQGPDSRSGTQSTRQAPSPHTGLLQIEAQGPQSWSGRLVQTTGVDFSPDFRSSLQVWGPDCWSKVQVWNQGLDSRPRLQAWPPSSCSRTSGLDPRSPYTWFLVQTPGLDSTSRSRLQV